MLLRDKLLYWMLLFCQFGCGKENSCVVSIRNMGAYRFYANGNVDLLRRGCNSKMQTAVISVDA